MIFASNKSKNRQNIRKYLKKEYFRSCCSINRIIESPSFSPKSSFSSNNTIKNKRQIITPQNEKAEKIFLDIKYPNLNTEKNNISENGNNNYFNLNTISNSNLFVKPKNKFVFNSITINTKALIKNLKNNISNPIIKSPQKFILLEKSPMLAKKNSHKEKYHKRNKTQFKTDFVNSLYINSVNISKNKKFENLINKNYKTIVQYKYLNQRKKIVKNKYREKRRQNLRDKISNEIIINSKVRLEKYTNLFNMIDKSFNEIKKLIDMVGDKNIIIRDISGRLNTQFGDSLNLNMPPLFEESINLNFSNHKKLYNNCTNTTINNDFTFEEEKQNIKLKTFKVNNNAFFKKNINANEVKNKINTGGNLNNNIARNKCIEKIKTKGDNDNNKICKIF